MGADQNFFRNRSVGLYSENHHKPSNLGYERIAMDQLSLCKKPQETKREISRKQTRKTSKKQPASSPPVRPVLGTGQTGSGHRLDRSFLDSPKFNLQKMNLEQTMSKSNETWRIPSQLSREHIPKRSLPKDQRNLRIRGMIKEDWGFLKNVKNSNS